MRRLRATKEILLLMGSLSLQALRALYLLGVYKVKKSLARRSALKELRASGLSEEVCRELLDIVVPDIGGVVEWGNSMRSRSCCSG